MRYQEAELQLKIQRLSTTFQALRLQELGPGYPTGPSTLPRCAVPPAVSSTPPPAHQPTVAPAGFGGQAAQAAQEAQVAAQVATPSTPDLSDFLMDLTL